MRNRHRYPPDWEQISRQVREEAGNCCEGSPAYPDCRAENGEPHPVTGSRVILTVAHLGIPKPDGTPGDPADKMDCRRENLISQCQRCHLRRDRDEHKRARKEKKA